MKVLLASVSLALVLVGCSAGEITPVMDSSEGKDADVAADGVGADLDSREGDLGQDLPQDFKPADEACVPDCAGRECGEDGCGGTCGTCPAAAPICAEGICKIECKGSCEGLECGDDGCGGDCGKCPAAAPYCKEGLCAVECDADCSGKQCGDDGCGGSCGTCDQGWACESGQCTCTPLCANKECGDNGCGGVCGTCDEETPFCVAGKCEADCTPQCQGKECGDDGCGGDCGACLGANSQCQEGLCICLPNCPAGSCGLDGCGGTCPECGCGQTCDGGVCVGSSCEGKQCGADPCGGECGTCPGGYQCSDMGLCLDSCDLACEGRECGSNGCGGVCGLCSAGKVCTDAGHCVATCTPQCTGKACGPDGCGGSCGACPGATPNCNAGQCSSLCIPDCGIAVCGDDGCGGVCGECESGLNCTAGGSCGGLCSMCHFEEECFDITFADGNLGMWSIASAQVVTNFGVAEAPTGGHMLLLTTQTDLDLEGDESTASFQNCLPEGDYLMLISWKMISEEFKEYCGSTYQDNFVIEVTTDAGAGKTVTYTVDNLCAPEECPGCGDHYSSLTASDVPLDQGDAWATGWYEDSVPILLQGPAASFTVTLRAKDAGDGIYDTVVLVDRIRFVTCQSACESLECGPNPCGGSCGQCATGSTCIGGTCCKPSCAGKECGNDGCGGSCGLCGSDSMCMDGLCECKNTVCDDGCCNQGEVCGTASGKCCMPQCITPCTANGCGGICPGPDGATCCSINSQCNDNNVCTIDACVSGICQHTPSGSPECCADLQFTENFDDGQAQGFTIANTDGGFGLGGGWSVTNACGSHTPSYSLFFGFTTDPLGGTASCSYANLVFPIPLPLSGTVTMASMDLPSEPTVLRFWLYPDIVADAGSDQLEVQMVQGTTVTTVWDKSDLTAGVGASWRQVTVDLSAWANETVQIRFSFNMVSSPTGSTTGPRVDDILVQGNCP